MRDALAKVKDPRRGVEEKEHRICWGITIHRKHHHFLSWEPIPKKKQQYNDETPKTKHPVGAEIFLRKNLMEADNSNHKEKQQGGGQEEGEEDSVGSSLVQSF